MTMKPRDRVLAALDHGRVDRIPLDFWGTPEVWEMMQNHFGTESREDVLKNLQVDVREFNPDYIGPPIKKEADGSFFDPKGMHRRPVKNEFSTYHEYASWPLGYVQTVADFESYDRWPNPDHYDYEGLRDKIGDAHETYYVKLFTGGLFETAWGLRGYEQFLMDMALEPEIPHYIMGKLTDFFCEFIKRTMAAAGDKYDMVYTYDDIATQNSLLISKDMWAEFIKPYHERLNKVIHDCGKIVMYHSCGAVYDMIGELAALPIEVLNPIQPGAVGMDMAKIKENHGDKLCFHGGIDIQHTLPKGTQQDVRDAVDHAITNLGRGGGFILTSAHSIQADTPVENIIAMYEHAQDFDVRKLYE